MPTILSIENLTYKEKDHIFFHNFNLEIEEKSFTSIIAPNKAGKTMLTKILCAIIPTDNTCIVDGISLNKQTVLEYITKIGIVTNEFNKQFLFKTVIEELEYPLDNLGYSNSKTTKRINTLLKFFDCFQIKDKLIKELTRQEKNKLIIILALIHSPKILILDDIFSIMDTNEKKYILKKLKDLNDEDLTILNITSQIDTIYESQQVMVLNDFKIEQKGSVLDLLEMDSYLNKIGLEIPFIIDLSLKLKFYGLIDKIYFNLEELERNLWK